MRKGELRINDLNSLIKWNENPTNEEVFVVEWFYDFICQLLKDDFTTVALEARKEMIKFTLIYEKSSEEKATETVDKNIEYWDDRAGYNVGVTKIRKIFNTTKLYEYKY